MGVGRKEQLWITECVLLNKACCQGKLVNQSQTAGQLSGPNEPGGKGSTQTQLPPAFHVGEKRCPTLAHSSHPVLPKRREKTLRSPNEVHSPEVLVH